MKESKLGLLIEGKAVRRLSFNNANLSTQAIAATVVGRFLNPMKGKSRCASFPFHVGPTSILSQALRVQCRSRSGGIGGSLSHPKGLTARSILADHKPTTPLRRVVVSAFSGKLCIFREIKQGSAAYRHVKRGVPSGRYGLLVRRTDMRCHWIIRLCAVAFLSVGVSSAQAAIDRQVTIQPILVYNDATGGAKLASAGGLVVFFEEEADKIWAQAGMDVEFLTPASLDNPTFVDLDNAAEFLALTTGAGNGQSSDPLVVNMWFVDDIWGGAFGVAWLSENGIAIANDTFQWDLAHHPEGRIDTIAHELGHNLGLGHWTGTNAANHLMADGGIRNVASDLAHILINGTDPSTGGPELLTPDEIAVARGSPFARDLDAVPEPATFLLWSGFGAMALVVGWRRRQGVL